MTQDRQRPTVGVGIAVWNEGKVLVAQITIKNTGEVVYGVPGGHWESGETLKETAKREAKEEAGVEVNNVRLASIYEFYNQDRDRWYLTVGMRGDYIGGEPRPRDDETKKLYSWRWMDPEEALKLNFYEPDRVLIERCLSRVMYQ